MEITEKDLQRLLDHMKEDYANWQGQSNPTDSRIKQEMYEEFCESLEYTYGNKYIKIIGDHSVKGFIVNTTRDKKFQYGDLLMAAGWNKPARNFARGNIFDETYSTTIKWTGIS